MAKSGTLSTTYLGWTYRIEWSATQSVENNTSTITCVHKLVCDQTYGLSISNRTNECTVDSVAKTFKSASFSTGGGTTITLGTTTHTVSHDANGAKICTISGTFNIKATLSGTYKESLSVSGSIALDRIMQASQPSLITWPENTQDVGDFGNEISIHMNRKSEKYTHTVRYEFGTQSGTIATGVTTGTKWTIPLTLMNLIPDATSGSGRVYVDTYNGSTLIGTKYSGFTATVPASVKPTCTCTLDDVEGIDDIYGSPVQGLSRIKATVSATKAYGSPIKTYSITMDGVRYSTSSATSGYLTRSGTSAVLVRVVDSRGRTGSWSYNMSVLAYTPPSVNKLTVHRCDEDGTENEQGEYVKVTMGAVVSPLGNKNNASYNCWYKKSLDTDYTHGLGEIGLPGSANYSPTNLSFIFAADSNSTYDIEAIAADNHKSDTRTTTVSTAFTLMNWNAEGNGMCFGGVAEEENTLRNNLELRQVGNSYSFQPGAFSGEKGYTLLAVITLKELNVNAPIVFTINRRGALCPMQVYVRFASSSTTTDPGLGSITYDGDNFGAFLVKSGASTWKLYVDNTSGWSNPCLQSWYTTDNQMTRLEVVFPNEQVAGTSTDVLKEQSSENKFYRATPAKMQSILDFIYPVGSIYLAYNHDDPGTLFGGTWVRISNAFLWAADGSGVIGQTGGEKNVTLTVDQIPSHTHGSVYSQHASGTKDKAWYSTTGTSVAYGTVATGGGEAHNNMPPYIQISAWRRTG